MRKRTSPIWVAINDEEFRSLIKESSSFKDVLSYFALENKGHNYRTLKKRIKELNINISHIQKHFFKMVELNLKNKIPLEDILVKNSTYNQSSLKNRLLKEDLLENVCNICGLSKKWNGKSIVLILDHINGISNDNRIENLRFVCPNCNSQLDTHCGKNDHSRKRKRYLCSDCDSDIGKNAKRCLKCNSKRRRKVERPPVEILKSEVDKFGYLSVGRKYGVSDNAIRKWIKYKA